MKHWSSVVSLGSWTCFSLLLLAGTASAAPCVSATTACTERIVAVGGPASTLAYRTVPLDAKNEQITRGLVLVHGGARDAHNYFSHALAAAFLAGALEDTAIVAPRFASNDGGRCQDQLVSNELNWKCTWENSGALLRADWRTGGPAADNATLTSYDVVDAILVKLANKAIFPSLRAIVVAGHSGGGFFVARYQMANQVHDRLGVPITYVVANAGSFPYLDSLRPTLSAIPSAVAATPGYLPWSTDPPPPFVEFADARNCTTYDRWPYGIQNRNGYYSARVSDDQLKLQLAARPTTYLLGQLDTVLFPQIFDVSCAAMAQGPTYLARGLAWGKYVKEKYGARHQTLIVPLCGHNARCMLTADPALPLLFPK